jgi:hypothetical protein
MEIWKDIEEFNGYQISNLGNVRTLDKLVDTVYNAKRTIKARVLKKTIRAKGSKYLCVGLYKDKKSKLMSVHRLVALAFLENLDNHKIVMHLDDNPSNNNVCNLKWGTYSQNNCGRNQYTIKNK